MKSRLIRCKPIPAAIFVLMALLIAGGPASVQAASLQQVKPEITELKIGIPALSPTQLPNWAADQKGFFKDEGFTDVKILLFQGDAPTVQALAAGTVDLNVASLTGLVNTILSGQKFKAIRAGYNMTPFEWYAQPKYKSIAETRGGRYGISKYGGMTDFLTRYALRKAGLDPEKDIKILQIGQDATILSALLSGQLDAAILAIPYTYTAAEKGLARLMSQRENVSPDYPTHAVYAKEEFIARNPNTVKAYMRATGKAMEWIKGNPGEAAQLVSKQLKYSPEYSRKAVNELTDGWYPDGRLPQEGMKVFWAIAVEAGDVKEPWPNNRWLDDTFLKTQDQWRK
jgi:NitT/TauT family transport system substrate-binding protein